MLERRTRTSDEKVANRANQMRESGPLRFWFTLIEINAVVAKVNAGQHDLSKSAINQDANFIQHCREGSAVHLWSDGGDDAITATQQTAVLNFDVRAVAIVQARNAVGNINDPEPPQQIGKLAFIRDDFGHPGS